MHTPPPERCREMPLRLATSDPTPSLPAAPRPSADSGMYDEHARALRECTNQQARDDGDDGDQINIFTLPPLQALKMLVGYVDSLVETTSDVPPQATPLAGQPWPPMAPGAPANGENVRPTPTSPQRAPHVTSPTPSPSPPHPSLDRVPESGKTPIGSPVAHPFEPVPDSHPASPGHSTHFVAQTGALARKFYSKAAPPISLFDYLSRLQRYCPMSTAVYLAAGVYIRRLTADCMLEKPGTPEPLESSDDALPAKKAPRAPVLAVTSRTAHRLLLAALRVAMKALEDLSYAHKRFAAVGGVTVGELGRLEISFCFLAEFELVPDAKIMTTWARDMRGLAGNVHEDAAGD